VGSTRSVFVGSVFRGGKTSAPEERREQTLSPEGVNQTWKYHSSSEPSGDSRRGRRSVFQRLVFRS
jgi:hypothetical protein